jgi:GTP-binding protein Era
MKSGLVVLAGRPNTGKSTFLNAVLGESISIVTPKAQTTRDQIRGILSEERGQVVFIDTPGIHRAREGGINAFMIQEVRRALEGPDVVLYLIDPASKPEAERLVIEHLRLSDAPLIAVINKADLRRSDPARFDWIPAFLDELKTSLEGTKCSYLDSIEISAEKNDGVQTLLDRIFSMLPEGPPLYEDPEALTDRSSRFVVAEMIRKQLFMKLGDEIPYSCAVEIEEFRENFKPIAISALIHVERESQKGMVIGAGGKKIKEIGTAARKEIEVLLGERVFLELRVKVLEAWTSESRKMRSLGYELERGATRKGGGKS